jgi:hypothetical protein
VDLALTTYSQYPKQVNIKPQLQPVTKLYQAGPAPRWTQSLENQTLVADGWKSRQLSLFGVRLYNGHLPTISPHGTLRVAVPFSNIVQSEEDFIIPLLGEGSNGVRDRLIKSDSGNYYFNFVYVREADIKAPNLTMDDDTRRRLREWRIGSHPYIRLTDGTLSYRRFVAGEEVWYGILVPYRIEFETDPFDDQTVWDDVNLRNSTWGNAYGVTDPTAKELVLALSIFAVQ